MLTKRYTILLISVAAFVLSSIVLLLVAISSDHWKYVTQQRTYNKTVVMTEYSSHSGLFRTCFTAAKPPQKVGCQWIALPVYDSNADSNAQNAYFIVLLSLVFPVLSGATLLIATFLCLLGFYSHSRRSLLLFGSLFYVTSGLLNVVGLMCYINRTNDELGPSKKKEEDIIRDYQYAWSFYLATISFGFTEVSAVLSVYFHNELLRLTNQIKRKRNSGGGGSGAELANQCNGGAMRGGGGGSAQIQPNNSFLLQDDFHTMQYDNGGHMQPHAAVPAGYQNHKSPVASIVAMKNSASGYAFPNGGGGGATSQYCNGSAVTQGRVALSNGSSFSNIVNDTLV